MNAAGPHQHASSRLYPDGGEPTQYVLYPIFESHDEQTFKIARDIADGANMTLLVLDFVEDEVEAIDETRNVGSTLLASHVNDEHDFDTKLLFEETARPVQTLTRVARDHETRLIVFDYHTPESLVHPISADVPNRISERVPCDVVTVERTARYRISTLLTPVAGGSHSSLSVAIAGAIARSVDAVVELFHVSESTDSEGTAESYFDAAREQLPDDVDVETWHVEGADVVDAIVEQTAHYDMTIIGEPTRGRLKRFLFGSVTDEVREKATNTVLVCRRSDRGERRFHGAVDRSR